jgi:cysteinyl-tRNA synthetase
VRYFVHNAFLVGMEGAKISKSAGRFPVLKDLEDEKINPLAFRLLCLGAKYRSELAFSLDAVRAAERNLYYLWNFTRTAPDNGPDSTWVAGYLERFTQALNDDLNTPEALAVVLEMVNKANRDNDRQIWNALKTMDRVLGLRIEEQFNFLAGKEGPPSDVQALIGARMRAREEKNYKLSDDLRAQIVASGWTVKDNADGTSVYMPAW